MMNIPHGYDEKSLHAGDAYKAHYSTSTTTSGGSSIAAVLPMSACYTNIGTAATIFLQSSPVLSLLGGINGVVLQYCLLLFTE